MNPPPSIPFGRPWITADERQAVLDVLDSPILTHGPQCKAFEEEFAAFLGEGAYCVSVSSCTAALHLAYFYFGLGAGDEVIVPAQTHTATAHAVELVGAKAVFVDCILETGNVDPAAIEAAITERTKAISIVHFLGIACPMDEIVAIANRHNLKVIEDSALAVGTYFDGKHAGLHGDVGAFSFYPVKHITTAEGGMFVTRHREIADAVRKLRGFGVDRTFSERKVPGMYDVLTLGFNYRMSDVQAAIGRQQIHKIPDILERRAANFRRLQSHLAAIPNTLVIDSQSPRSTNSFYCLTLVLRGPIADSRDAVVEQLNARGIGTSIYYPQPVPRMTYYREKYGYDASRYPNATAISDCSIALPVGPHIGLDEMDYIGKTVQQVIQEMTP